MEVCKQSFVIIEQQGTDDHSTVTSLEHNETDLKVNMNTLSKYFQLTSFYNVLDTYYFIS